LPPVDEYRLPWLGRNMNGGVLGENSDEVSLISGGGGPKTTLAFRRRPERFAAFSGNGTSKVLQSKSGYARDRRLPVRLGCESLPNVNGSEE